MFRTHLATLDRALLRLLEERARLCEAHAAEGSAAPSIEDLMRRADGNFDPGALRQVFAVIERGSTPRRER